MLLPSGARLEKWVKIGNFLVLVQRGGEERSTGRMCYGEYEGPPASQHGLHGRQARSTPELTSRPKKRDDGKNGGNVHKCTYAQDSQVVHEHWKYILDGSITHSHVA